MNISVYEFYTIIFVLCIIVIVISLLITDGVDEINIIPYSENRKKCLDNVYEKSKIPDVNQFQCLLTEYNKCPRFNGSLKQCTNNYIPTPKYGNCPCHNRTFEMCPQKWKVAEDIYEPGAMKCDPIIEDTYSPEIPSKKSRINYWRYEDKVDKNFLIQCDGDCCKNLQ